MILSLTVAGGALGALAATLAFGRRDLAHPAVAFGAVWFAFVAASQLRLTGFEHRWSPAFAGVVFGGALVLVLGTLLATGTRPARGSLRLLRMDYQGGKLMIAALVLLAGGAVGLAWKAHLLGGVPLFSGQIDELRLRAYGSDGDIAAPAWSTFLTDGFYLAAWCLLASAWAGWARSPHRRVLLGILLAVAVAGTAAGGSRNALLFMVAVPAVAAYTSRPSLPRRAIAWSAAVAIAGVGLTSAVFLLRVDQREGDRQAFISNELRERPSAVRPLLALYFGGAFSLETERRIMEAFPSRFSYGVGGYTLQGLPDAAFPLGKAPYGDVVGSLTYRSSATTPYWTVGTYQGRTLADFGVAGVGLVSLLLGLALGGAYRACRDRSGLFPLAVLGYVAYFAAFLFYDNLASIALLAVAYDLAVLAAIDLVARRETAPAERAGAYGTKTCARTG